MRVIQVKMIYAVPSASFIKTIIILTLQYVAPTFIYFLVGRDTASRNPFFQFIVALKCIVLVESRYIRSSLQRTVCERNRTHCLEWLKKREDKL